MNVELVSWQWWLSLAGLFLISELVSYSFFFIALAVGAALTALMAWSYPHFHLAIELCLYSLFSLAALSVWAMWRKKMRFKKSTINDISAELLGKTFVLQAPDENGVYRAELAGTSWRIEGNETLAPGDTVKVIKAHGTKVWVEKTS